MATTSSKISPVGTNNYKTDVTTNADGSLKATTFRVDKTGANPVAVSTVNTAKDGTTTRTMESGATAAEKTAFNNPNSTERKTVNTQIKDAKPYGANPSVEQQKQINAAAGNQNAATTSPSADGSQGASSLTEGQSKALGEENKYKENTRAGDSAYGTDLKYPLNLKSEVQDVIKFSILEYSPSLAKENQSTTGQFGSGKSRVVTLESSGIPIVKGSTRIGVVTLPIPAGINDGNTVGWQNDQLNMLQSEAAGIAQGFLTGGVAGAGERLDATGNNLQAGSQSGDLQSAVTSLFVGSAVANSNIAGRTYGAAGNNNLELLFSNPNLRSFSFAFSFYPRGEDEAVMVRRIIRAFKQSMSVKRSQTSLLLKAPHTFAISYVTAGGKAQPYLNSFKECALTSCSVDYTPDGTYMTYGGKEKSMTAYRLSLQFQELEPIFDDEYYDIDKNDDTSIGF
jgi:hypothetical protein